MNTRKLLLLCPLCGSGDVFYTCTPNCCFNHVCNHCNATFEPVTHATGASQFGVKPPDPMPDSTEPTAGCAKCDSINVWMLDDNRLVCGDCASILELEITEVTKA